MKKVPEDHINAKFSVEQFLFETCFPILYDGSPDLCKKEKKCFFRTWTEREGGQTFGMLVGALNLRQFFSKLPCFSFKFHHWCKFLVRTTTLHRQRSTTCTMTVTWMKSTLLNKFLHNLRRLVGHRYYNQEPEADIKIGVIPTWLRLPNEFKFSPGCDSVNNL